MTPFDAGDLRTKPGRWERATNAQQRLLVKAYDQWAAQLQRDLQRASQLWTPQAGLELIVDKALPALENAMLEATHKGIQTAEKIGLNGTLPSPRVLTNRQEHITKNDKLVSENLVPFIGQRIKEQLATGIVSEPKLLTAGLAVQRLSAASYAGGFWAMIFETKKAKGQDEAKDLIKQGLPPRRVRWVLDPSAEHCKASSGYYGCPELAGVYDSWDALPTVPAGMVTCRGSCRCLLEIEVNGQWRRDV